MGSSSGDIWSFNFDAGTATITNTQTLLTLPWTVTDVTYVDNLDGTYSADMLFNYSTAAPVPVSIDWDIDLSQVITANTFPITEGPFLGNTITFDGPLTGQVVPIPAAAWLFGSGLLGLIAIARRKKVA